MFQHQGGLTDLGGSLTGTADYDVFGELRTSSGVSSVFGFTGEQFDAETGFTFLRTRYLDPRLGRFLSADSVQPNAPGTEGYNLYTYVANNPTTWADPSGHYANGMAALTAYVMAHPAFIVALVMQCKTMTAVPAWGQDRASKMLRRGGMGRGKASMNG